MSQHEKLMNQEELCEALGVTRRCVSGWVARGLPGFIQRTPGKRPVYALSRAIEWAQKQDWIRAELPKIKEDQHEKSLGSET